MRFVIAMFLLSVAAVCGAGDSGGVKSNEKAVANESGYDIGEFNKHYWRWRRCVYRWEEEHGDTDAKGAEQLCGKEPVAPTS